MDHIDSEIRHFLKSWVDHQPLPAEGRSQLIEAAIALRDNKENKSSLGIGGKPNELISWAMVYCVDRRISTARLVS